MAGSQALCFCGFCGQGAFPSVRSLFFIQPCYHVPDQARVDTASPGAEGAAGDHQDLGLAFSVVNPQALQLKGHSVYGLLIGDEGALRPEKFYLLLQAA